MKWNHLFLNKCLTVLAASLLTSSLHAQEGNLKITNKHDFTQQLGEEWIEIDDGIWRLETDAGYTEIGFGKIGAQRYLSYLQKLKSERKEKGKKTSDIEEIIIELDTALSTSKENSNLKSTTGSTISKSSNSTYPGNLVCGQPWYLEVTTQQGISNFFLSSRTKFEPFGPFAPYTVVIKSTSKIVDFTGATASDVEFERLQEERWASANTSVSLPTFLGTWESTGTVLNTTCSGWSWDDWAYIKKVGSYQ